MKLKISIVSLILIVFLTACGTGTQATPTPNPDVTPTPTFIPRTPPVSIPPTTIPSGEGPLIIVNKPTMGDKISSPFTIQGSAIVFEANVNYRLRDKNNQVLAKGNVMASAGAPSRGTYSTSVSFTPSEVGAGWLEVFEVSAKDGSEINKVVIYVNW